MLLAACMVKIYQYDAFQMCVNIVGSSICQCGFANHSVVESVNKIQILSFFTFFHK